MGEVIEEENDEDEQEVAVKEEVEGSERTKAEEDVVRGAWGASGLRTAPVRRNGPAAVAAATDAFHTRHHWWTAQLRRKVHPLHQLARALQSSAGGGGSGGGALPSPAETRRSSTSGAEEVSLESPTADVAENACAQPRQQQPFSTRQTKCWAAAGRWRRVGLGAGWARSWRSGRVVELRWMGGTIALAVDGLKNRHERRKKERKIELRGDW
ncbi:hypothetical protein DFJ73DRAFT_956663 [Zopfochytrium polystomum]|nr:hypothetical protein DFJ73DRAFT_956663 [Zopfochytrium polystomum]